MTARGKTDHPFVTGTSRSAALARCAATTNAYFAFQLYAADPRQPESVEIEPLDRAVLTTPGAVWFDGGSGRQVALIVGGRISCGVEVRLGERVLGLEAVGAREPQWVRESSRPLTGGSRPDEVRAIGLGAAGTHPDGGLRLPSSADKLFPSCLVLAHPGQPSTAPVSRR